jgi:hypothetical protein
MAKQKLQVVNPSLSPAKASAIASLFARSIDLPQRQVAIPKSCLLVGSGAFP